MVESNHFCGRLFNCTPTALFSAWSGRWHITQIPSAAERLIEINNGKKLDHLDKSGGWATGTGPSLVR